MGIEPQRDVLSRIGSLWLNNFLCERTSVKLLYIELKAISIYAKILTFVSLKVNSNFLSRVRPYKLNFVFWRHINIKTILNVIVAVNRIDFYRVILRVAISHRNNHAKFDPIPDLIRRKKHRTELQWKPYWRPSSLRHHPSYTTSFL